MGSLREAAAICSSKKDGNVHVGAAIMPQYLNAHYDPYSSVLNRGMYEYEYDSERSSAFVAAAIMYNRPVLPDIRSTGSSTRCSIVCSSSRQTRVH